MVPDVTVPLEAQRGCARAPDGVEWLAIDGVLLGAFAFTTAATGTSAPGPTTTLPGSEITYTGGPNATTDSPGTHNDGSDFYGLGLALLVIVGAIFLTRLVFRRPGGRSADAEGPR
jgi:hypothetical protein